VLGAQVADLVPEFRHARVVRGPGGEDRQLRLLGRDLLHELSHLTLKALHLLARRALLGGVGAGGLRGRP